VAGSGIAVSSATGAVTISTAAPSYNAVGSYITGYFIISRPGSTLTWSAGATFPAGGSFADSVVAGYGYIGGSGCGTGSTPVYNLSGTWRLMASGSTAESGTWPILMVRVS
jgi:hypothetical protein